MYKKHLIILSFTILLVSCKSRTAPLEIEDAALAKVVATHYDNEADFKTMTGRMKLSYTDDERSQSVTVSYRMQKDSAIWMSAQVLGIPLAKVLVTPTKVSYYEKINQTYFEGDFSLLSKWLGTPLDFKKLQNLLLGQTIYDLREERYKLTESSRGYQLVPVNTMEGVTKMFLLDPRTFKATAQQLAQEKENRNVTVTYPGYQTVDGRTIPEKIKIIANSEGTGTQVEINYNSVELNVPVSFPFDIPSGYEEIEI